MDWEKWEEWFRRIFYWYGYMTEITMIKPERKIFLSLLLSISRSLSYHSNHCWFISLIKYSLSRLLYTKFGPFLILFDILCSPCLHIYTNVSYQICVCVCVTFKFLAAECDAKIISKHENFYFWISVKSTWRTIKILQPNQCAHCFIICRECGT